MERPTGRQTGRDTQTSVKVPNTFILLGRSVQSGFEGLPKGFPDGSETLPAGFEALSAGSEALPAGSEALPAGSEALLAV